MAVAFALHALGDPVRRHLRPQEPGDERPLIPPRGPRGQPDGVDVAAVPVHDEEPAHAPVGEALDEVGEESEESGRPQRDRAGESQVVL
jgi:hypothetical protein